MTTTPPHHPTHNIKFTQTKIDRIITLIFPKNNVGSIEQLQSGKSFNNRIYFINLISSTEENDENVVLKVSGQFFGPEKVQNEVASLYLLERYCPTVPVPRVLAWCDHGLAGSDMYVFKRSSDGSSQKVAIFKHPTNDDDSSERGWILLSKRPGRQLEDSDLVGQAGESIMRELAYSVSQMRKKIPNADRIGNLRLYATTTTLGSPDSYIASLGQEIRVGIGGLLNCTQMLDKPIFSALEYFQTKLQDQMTRLRTEEVFASKRAEVVAVLERFVAEVLPKIEVLQKSAPPVFTHNDFSPRNVLVSGSPPSVTGLVDYEFAGFFPPEEEFANTAVCNEGDWPALTYETFLIELERLDVKTPWMGFSGKRWKEAMLLMKLSEDVAPWFLREGGIESEELLRECQRAADSVVRCIEELQNAMD